MYSSGFHPDGLTESLIDALLAEVAEELADLPPATSALADGSVAAQRKNRRAGRRAVGAVVRALPARRPVSDPDGKEAA